jgi:hypothetical protein
MLILLAGIQAPCQSKKERKKNRIKSVTEWETITVEGKSMTFKTALEEFDKAGRSILRAEYAPDGTVTARVTATYDRYGNKTAATEFDAGKQKNLMWTYRYNALKDKTEEAEYNAKAELIKRTVYAYDAGGNKISETETDAGGNLLSKSVFTYNSKNLKTGKTTVAGTKKTDKSKKWEYVYH